MGLAFSCPEDLAEDLGWAGLQAVCDCNFFIFYTGAHLPLPLRSASQPAAELHGDTEKGVKQLQ